MNEKKEMRESSFICFLCGWFFSLWLYYGDYTERGVIDYS